MRKGLGRSTGELAEFPLMVSTKGGVTPEYLQEETARLRSRERIDLVVVDHMQLMAATGSVRGDYEKFTSISRTLKQTAMEVKIPVLLISQTSRSNSSAMRSELEVSDLRGSGAIEEDACAVMLLYPEKEDRERALAEGRFAKGPLKTVLKLGKNRYGWQGVEIPLMHHKTCTRFDLIEQHEEER